MLGVASSGGTLGIFLAAMALSCRPSLAWLLGAALSGNFVLGMLLKAPASAAAAAAAAATAQQPQAPLLAYLSDPVALVGALVRSLKSSAASPGTPGWLERLLRLLWSCSSLACRMFLRPLGFRD